MKTTLHYENIFGLCKEKTGMSQKNKMVDSEKGLRRLWL